jgi:hypothetical protein
MGISVICPGVPEELAQYYDTAAIIEFTPFCKLFGFAF